MLLTLAISLLLLNGVGAFYGSYHLITDPTGMSLGMPVTWLQYSPFTNYLVPGIVLLVANGIGSFIALGILPFKIEYRFLGIAFEGALLFGWIAIQVMMLQTLAALQIVFGTMGLILIVAGLILAKTEKGRNTPLSA